MSTVEVRCLVTGPRRDDAELPALPLVLASERLTVRELTIVCAEEQVREDNPPPGHPHLQATSVPASESTLAFVDVVAHIQGAPVLQLLRTVPGVEPWFPIARYEVTSGRVQRLPGRDLASQARSLAQIGCRSESRHPTGLIQEVERRLHEALAPLRSEAHEPS